eukprot:10387-Heterococcus_DN1.PRE.1
MRPVKRKAALSPGVTPYMNDAGAASFLDSPPTGPVYTADEAIASRVPGYYHGRVSCLRKPTRIIAPKSHRHQLGAIFKHVDMFVLLCDLRSLWTAIGIYSAYIRYMLLLSIATAGVLMPFDTAASLPEQMLMQQQLQQQMHMQLQQQQQMMTAPPQQQQQVQQAAAPATMGAYKSPHAQRKCEYQGCTKAPSYAFRGKSAAFCGAHREPNM